MKNINIICFEPSRQLLNGLWTSRPTRMRTTPILLLTGHYNNFPFWTGWATSPKHALNMTFCGPARDTVLTNWQTEKLNFDTCYITSYFIIWQWRILPNMVVRTRKIWDSITRKKAVLHFLTGFSGLDEQKSDLLRPKAISFSYNKKTPKIPGRITRQLIQ